MQKTILFFLLLFVLLQSNAQVKWDDGKIPFNEIEWNNYTTSFIGDGNERNMLGIVTAVPYNGVYNFGDEGEQSALDITYTGSLYRLKSNLSDKVQKLYTYDSSEVFFLVPGIYPKNAAQFEYRESINGDKELQPWSNITEFSDVKFSLNNFSKGFAYLGGYKTTWGNFLLVELRKKNTTGNIFSSAVYWKQVKPRIANIYMADEINELFSRMKEYYKGVSSNELKKWQKDYTTEQLGADGLPKKLLLKPEQNSIIFYLSSNVYEKAAIEYAVSKDGKEYIQWKPNEFDNNLIWLKNLPPGDYKLQIRYKMQPQNVTEYPFEIKPAWHQTTLFKIISGSLVAAFFGFILLLFRTVQQKRQLRKTQATKEKAEMDLKQLRSQLNPHFIFNALSSIQGLVNNHELGRANQYLAEFSAILRESLKNNDNDFIPLVQEIKILETYIKLEQLRFGFAYSINISDRLNTSEINMPSLLIQPLIENAIKHGIGALKNDGRLTVDFFSKGNDFCIDIKDNGKGFNENTKDGFGLKLTKDRIQLLNQNNKTQPIILALTTNNGTTVHLTFENWLA